MGRPATDDRLARYTYIETEILMSLFTQRFPLVVLALMAAVAATDVSVARAAVFDEGVIPTACDNGVLKDCGWRDIMQCDIEITGTGSLLARSGGFEFRRVCHKAGEMRLYKDQPSQNSGGVGCQVRRGEDGEEMPFEDPVCEA